MKNFLYLVCIALFCASATSCKKDSPAQPTHKIEYRVMNANRDITSIHYIDSLGNSVTGDENTQNDTLWTKTITVTGNKFNAEMDLTTYNPTSNELNFIMAIFVDGVNKNVTYGDTPPNSYGTGTAAYSME